VLAGLGQREEIRDLLKDWEAGRWHSYLSLAEMACAYTAAGDYDKALTLLERDCQEGDRVFWTYYQIPFFDPIRDNPRFAALLQAMKLPTTLSRRYRWTG
jgi:hypothetical protein